ncbi:hypothetical protein IFM89_014938 [Coptis chinensis]|uniref:AMP-activated protein kinase glycogen-binding domain-containing protein n=1 Tax=Coptis chinensis TaxID=261450 RepID=A0A835LEE3_9MAGN|nr:hypothetical protein IFM89_014938 [Coptis chinensis]
MECHMAGVMRCLGMENIHKRRFKVGLCNTRRDYQKRTLLSNGKYTRRQSFALPISLEHKSSSSSAQEYSSNGDEATSEDSLDGVLSQKLASDELKSLLADSQRSKLVNKLSEANQQNRFLKRQLHDSEEALVSFKTELADLELEIKALATLAEEVAKSGIPQDSRKINGKYIQSHLLSRLEAVHVKLKEQVKDVDVVQSKEVPLYWVGMAESVKVMGSFDGWSEGKQLSPEYTDSFSKFSATLMLRPGRYEIKFLVDGEWHLTPELPIIGEGMTINNLLIVE